MGIILLVDMDYFFAACEERRKPELKGKPVVVGFDPKEGTGRGVVSTCNYEARKFGIHSAMPISSAYRLKPDAVFLPIDYLYYEKISEEVMSLVKTFASKHEQVSVDEIYLDISSKAKGYDDALLYAKKIKEEINSKLNLPCSVGVSVNKLLAKMACEAAKPNGIKLVKQEEARTFLKNMSVGKLQGVGKVTEEKLKSLGYNTIGDIQNADPARLVTNFRNFGQEIYEHARGIDESEIIQEWEAKSIGRERTFDTDTLDKSTIEDKIREIAKEVHSELGAKGFSFKTITTKIRYHDFSEHLKSRSISYYSSDLQTITESAIKLFEGSIDKDKAVRKIGVRVSNFTKQQGQRRILDF